MIHGAEGGEGRKYTTTIITALGGGGGVRDNLEGRFVMIAAQFKPQGPLPIPWGAACVHYSKPTYNGWVGCR